MKHLPHASHRAKSCRPFLVQARTLRKKTLESLRIRHTHASCLLWTSCLLAWWTKQAVFLQEVLLGVPFLSPGYQVTFTCKDRTLIHEVRGSVEMLPFKIFSCNFPFASALRFVKEGLSAFAPLCLSATWPVLLWRPWVINLPPLEYNLGLIL